MGIANVLCYDKITLKNLINLRGENIMKLRAPSVPLITHDPYFSVWSPSDKLNTETTRHWTNSNQTMAGLAVIDGEKYNFCGKSNDTGRGGATPMEQVSLEIKTMSTEYIFEAAGISLTLNFLSPLFLDDVYLLSRPCSYLKLTAKSTDGKDHAVKIIFDVTEEICVDRKEEYKTKTDVININDGITAAKMGTVYQPHFNKAGDNVRIDWGYFYLCGREKTRMSLEKCRLKANPKGFWPSWKSPVDTDKHPHDYVECNMVSANIDLSVNDRGENSELLVFVYDDVVSLEYFHKVLKSCWTYKWGSIEEAISAAYAEYDSLRVRAEKFDEELVKESVKNGGEKYAEILRLAYRQAIAAHKAVFDTNGDLLFISKECFSNGCAATVDVSYPSIPLFLRYNPSLIAGMIRPIVALAENDKMWQFNFAPHDVGTYPKVNGQVYGMDSIDGQMPVEECGNMLVMLAAMSLFSNDATYALENKELFRKWVEYLEEFGLDPQNQLCTDDFAGHLAHNCNLAIKAIMGIAGYSLLCKMWGEMEESQRLMDIARDMAGKWLEMASDGEGKSTRLAFDKEGTFSLKYNSVWDKIFKTGLFPEEFYKTEVNQYLTVHMQKYGTPLDNRKNYTKADWLIWAAALSDDKKDFEAMIEPLWRAYNDMPSRVPMSDWYDLDDAHQMNFQHRSVVGGFFIKNIME